MAHDRRF